MKQKKKREKKGKSSTSGGRSGDKKSVRTSEKKLSSSCARVRERGRKSIECTMGDDAAKKVNIGVCSISSQ
jgi:hypothetical protein